MGFQPWRKWIKIKSNFYIKRKIILHFFNIFFFKNLFRGRAFNQIVGSTRPVYKFIKQGASKISDYFKYYKDKKKTSHPNYKEIAKA